MGTLNTRGFTIIETMLFLAISGVLIVAMIAGTGASINIQRYRDATETFKSLLQNQYGALTSVENDRTNNWSCSSLAASEDGGNEARGQSDCVLLGRLLTVVDSDISIYNVLGRPLTNSGPASDDIAELSNNYVLNISTVSKDTQVMEWGTHIAWNRLDPPNPARTHTTPRELSMLFIRSPSSGQIYTFHSDIVDGNPSPGSIKSMLVSGATIPGRAARTICIESNGLFVSADLSVYVSAYATGPSSIETQSNSFIADPTSPRENHGIQC
jgi:type II secretory pathway pseudopilin PulG